MNRETIIVGLITLLFIFGLLVLGGTVSKRKRAATKIMSITLTPTPTNFSDDTRFPTVNPTGEFRVTDIITPTVSRGEY